MAQFDVLESGNVIQRTPEHPKPLAAMSRCVVAGNGDILCTYLTQAKLGLNDFVSGLSRSNDGGRTWKEQGLIWPDVTDWSMACSISRSPEGRLFLFGGRTHIDVPGEVNWSDQTKGLKSNELFWASSEDCGHKWTAARVIPMPIPGAAECPAPMLITRSGRWIAPFSPYNTFDPASSVDRSQVVAIYSDDQGESWRHASMMRFEEQHSGGAEAWVCELSDGRILGSAWHADLADREVPVEYPNAYAISGDKGKTWSKTCSTGIQGHTTALTALEDGRAILTTVRRRKDAPSGIWLTVARPQPTDFGIESDQCVWSVGRATQDASDPGHAQWVKFNFGEPSVTRLPDGTFLLAFWYAEDSHSGIKYIRLKMIE